SKSAIAPRTSVSAMAGLSSVSTGTRPGSSTSSIPSHPAAARITASPLAPCRSRDCLVAGECLVQVLYVFIESSRNWQCGSKVSPTAVSKRHPQGGRESQERGNVPQDGAGRGVRRLGELGIPDAIGTARLAGALDHPADDAGNLDRKSGVQGT